MSEVLGNADPKKNPVDATLDDDELDDHELDDHAPDDGDGADDDFPDFGPGLASTLASPLALSITAIALAVSSLVGFFSTYILSSAFALANSQKDSLFGQRVTTGIELGIAVVAAIVAVLAHAAASRNVANESQRVSRGLAGAAFLLSLISIAQSVAALLLMAGVHLPPASGVG